MANAIIGGLVASGTSAKDIIVSDPYEPTRIGLEKAFGCKTTQDNNATIPGPNRILILAVKPQVMKAVAEGISKVVQEHRPLIITIAGNYD